MDRARGAGAPGPRRRWWSHRKGGPLSRTVALLALATLFACKLNSDLDQPVAIDVILPDSGRVEITDTFRPRARALNEIGDSVAAQIYWSSLDTAIIAVLDSATGVSLGEAVGSGRLQARVGSLRTDPQNVAVLPKLDSLRAGGGGATRDTVFVTAVPPDSLSDSLQVQAFASGGAATGRRVVYAATTYPASGPVVTLLPKDTVLTTSTGTALTQVRLRPGPVPDSVVVTATMRRLNGTQIPGSPVTFVVEFRP